MAKVFSLDRLPYYFGSEIKNEPPETEPGESLLQNANIGSSFLIENMLESGGFRFKKMSSNLYTGQDGASTVYMRGKCCQDTALSHPKDPRKLKRHYVTMARSTCDSSLILKICFGDCSLHVTLQHSHHPGYRSKALSPEIIDFIDKNNSQTPSELFGKITCSELPGSEHALSSQIYYRWHKTNSKTWRLSEDPLVSCMKYLDGKSDKYLYNFVQEGKKQAVMFYIREAMQALTGAKELVMDATYGTNSAGMDMFAVLAELDGSGIPLCYMFVEKGTTENTKPSANEGATIAVITTFLSPLKDHGFNPHFFGTDKDAAEIFAVRHTWPKSKHELCWWHVKRAIRSKMTTSDEADVLQRYRPEECEGIIHNFEHCWGSYPKLRALRTRHWSQTCDCPSRRERFVGRGCLEPRLPKDREEVLGIIDRHLNVHSFMPDSTGTFLPKHVIYQQSATEMYRFCRARAYFRLWAYLWVNWYKPDQWELWARAAQPEEIPVLRTTMILESHWRVIKHDFLHRFNRPRVDLVLYVLDAHAILRLMRKMRNILALDLRSGRSAWRKTFKSDWRRLSQATVSAEKFDQYHTDPINWVCGCHSFPLQRFLICKHLIACFKPMVDPTFFWTVTRSRTLPIWSHNLLELRPELEDRFCGNKEEDSAGEGHATCDESSDEDCDEVQELVREEHELSDDDEVEDEAVVEVRKREAMRDAFRQLLGIIVGQEQKGNEKFLSSCARSFEPMLKQARDLIKGH